MRRCVLVLCLSMITVMAYGNNGLTPNQEARAVALDRQIRCVVCQSESINDSEADMARDMRELIRTKIDAGWSDSEIISYMRTRYGDFILLQPPFQTNTWLLWLGPLAFLGLAAITLGQFLRRRLVPPYLKGKS